MESLDGDTFIHLYRTAQQLAGLIALRRCYHRLSAFATDRLDIGEAAACMISQAACQRVTQFVRGWNSCIYSKTRPLQRFCRPR